MFIFWKCATSVSHYPCACFNLFDCFPVIWPDIKTTTKEYEIWKSERNWFQKSHCVKEHCYVLPYPNYLCPIAISRPLFLHFLNENFCKKQFLLGKLFWKARLTITINLVFDSDWISEGSQARNMCTIFSLVPSKKPVTTENWDKLNVYVWVFVW